MKKTVVLFVLIYGGIHTYVQAMNDDGYTAVTSDEDKTVGEPFDTKTTLIAKRFRKHTTSLQLPLVAINMQSFMQTLIRTNIAANEFSSLGLTLSTLAWFTSSKLTDQDTALMLNVLGRLRITLESLQQNDAQQTTFLAISDSIETIYTTLNQKKKISTRDLITLIQNVTTILDNNKTSCET